MVGGQATPVENLEFFHTEVPLAPSDQDVTIGPLNGPNVNMQKVKHADVEGAQELQASTAGPLARGNGRTKAIVIQSVKQNANGDHGHPVSVADHAVVEFLVGREHNLRIVHVDYVELILVDVTPKHAHAQNVNGERLNGPSAVSPATAEEEAVFVSRQVERPVGVRYGTEGRVIPRDANQKKLRRK